MPISINIHFEEILSCLFNWIYGDDLRSRNLWRGLNFPQGSTKENQGKEFLEKELVSKFFSSDFVKFSDLIIPNQGSKPLSRKFGFVFWFSCLARGGLKKEKVTREESNSGNQTSKISRAASTKSPCPNMVRKIGRVILPSGATSSIIVSSSSFDATPPLRGNHIWKWKIEVKSFSRSRKMRW